MLATKSRLYIRPVVVRIRKNLASRDHRSTSSDVLFVNRSPGVWPGTFVWNTIIGDRPGLGNVGIVDGGKGRRRGRPVLLPARDRPLTRLIEPYAV